jgi:2-dehydro-3-deoxyphosphogalactonate aldolase
MNLHERWCSALESLPLIAILRGVQPSEVIDIGTALVDCGFQIFEIPLTSPEALQSVAYLAGAIGDHAIVGAGTVTRVSEVDQLKLVGCKLCISPHTDVDLIRHAKSTGMIVAAGVFASKEALAAIEAGADVLKLVTAKVVGPGRVRALRTALPAGVPIFPVGGITAWNMEAYLGAGARGFGLGGALYVPGDSVQAVLEKARWFVRAYRVAVER